MKDEWFRSSLVFDTISLKLILCLMQSLWCFETHGSPPLRIKWSIAQKRSTQDCVWHNFLKVDFAPHTITVVLRDSRTSASQDKIIYSTKMKHARSCSANYSMLLSLSLTQNECTKYSYFESFLLKVVFMNEGLCKIIRYWIGTLFQLIIVHRLTDSKIKIIKYYYLDK